ncbi:MAG TPA: DUF664 domain-containing protein, partial [Acidimicrobiales bacterium]|nr:DUF664 domain-containing protein [Acidimicrobiales bacterium]
MHDDETEQLLAFLEQQRSAVRLAAYGLSDEQAREAPSVSSLSVGGIIRHLTSVERYWTDVVLGQPSAPDAGAHERGFELGVD